MTVKKKTSSSGDNSNGKSRLSAKDLKFFRETLEAKRAELVGDVGLMKDQALNQSHDMMPMHMADIGSDSYEQEFTLGLIENENHLLTEIDEALKRITDGKYGICIATGKSISKSRLKHKPWAKYCIEYVKENEKNNNNINQD